MALSCLGYKALGILMTVFSVGKKRYSSNEETQILKELIHSL